jgi:hypothetical protein
MHTHCRGLKRVHHTCTRKVLLFNKFAKFETPIQAPSKKKLKNLHSQEDSIDIVRLIEFEIFNERMAILHVRPRACAIDNPTSFDASRDVLACFEITVHLTLLISDTQKDGWHAPWRKITASSAATQRCSKSRRRCGL